MTEFSEESLGEKIEDADEDELADSSDLFIHGSDEPLTGPHTTSDEEIDEARFNYWEQSIPDLVVGRLPMLITLLILQSISSVILDQFSDSILKKHEVIPIYLTMLVGTGGNSGGQSAALVLQGLATGEIKTSNFPALVFKEFLTSLILAVSIACVGFLRGFIQGNSNVDCLVLATILFFIVVTSILVGTLLPLFFSFLQNFLQRKIGEKAAMFVEPSNTTFPAFQVLMDIIGILITVGVSYTMYYSIFKVPEVPEEPDCVCADASTGLMINEQE
eukprot:CAMPEP_0201487766 /NCGR_PEP_ID=MMETSP0151_2-20130828/15216_1 /ASSEMBLY_ACC=CAM_ASM_000257 /TAXON_ID=200890 /ORGANISM="Paramoeba atlantica, Strain 621/1 / CCAP 1560/9" /LENGTH=274 /DNA_ID=CAMNT_0047872911 /DNA_START=134 /DNA_END=958 /DNA_ORIENTATION=+